MSNIKIGIIGCGNMGGAIARGMVRKKVASSRAISLSDKDIRKADGLAREIGAHPASVDILIKMSDIILVAVKPQDFRGLARLIKGKLSGKTVISVMAGKRIKDIYGALGKDVQVVRAMPNMPAVIGEGVTCIAHKGRIRHLCKVREIFESIGKVVELDESHLDAVTAVSGGGPAYLFYLADAMIEAGKSAGLCENAARELVLHTLHGAAALLKQSGMKPGDLVIKVASKRGTTEAALSVFKEEGVKHAVRRAILKAKQRSRELSTGDK